MSFHDRKLTKKGLPGIHFPAVHLGRHRTTDALTFDTMTHDKDAFGNEIGKKLGNAYTTHDGRTVDSTGAFYVNELERLDQTLHEPLASVTWGRDMPLREDVTIADDISSFTVSNFAASGGLGSGQLASTGNKSWIGKVTTEIQGVSVDIAKIAQPLTPWGVELKYTILELESSARIGRPIDQQKYKAMQMKHQFDIDTQVYVGDSIFSQYGLYNSNLRGDMSAVTNVTNVATGTSGYTQWAQKTPAEILNDVNEILVSAWAASGWAVFPDTLLVPPSNFGYISTALVSAAGSQSVLKYLQENNLLTQSGVSTMQIWPNKWGIGSGAGGTIGVDDGHNRMVAYRKDPNYIRFPMTMLQRVPIQYVGIYHSTVYYCKLGVVEIVYPETIALRDGV